MRRARFAQRAPRDERGCLLAPSGAPHPSIFAGSDGGNAGAPAPYQTTGQAKLCSPSIFLQKQIIRDHADSIIDLYERHAAKFDELRNRSLFEKSWLVRFAAQLPKGGKIALCEPRLPSIGVIHDYEREG